MESTLLNNKFEKKNQFSLLFFLFVQNMYTYIKKHIHYINASKIVNTAVAATIVSLGELAEASPRCSTVELTKLGPQPASD